MLAKPVIMGALLSGFWGLPQAPVVRSDSDSTERARAMHVLTRLAYGPGPGDVDRVMRMGVDAYIEQQLHPERIRDDRLDRVLDGFEILKMSTAELETIFRNLRRERAEAAMRADRDSAGYGGQMRMRPGQQPAQRGAGEYATRLRTLMGEFRQVAMARSVLAEQQLYEIVVDFWTNHFNVYIHKGAGPAMMPRYIEETIRPNALGRFEDLLIATARSPAMLYYLDNVESVAPGFAPPGRGRRPAMRQQDGMSDSMRMQARRPRGLNENYARELMELHTLGVDGGYTQDDVIDVARILTGWTLNPRVDLNFIFYSRAHDFGEKTVLGRTFPAGRGIEEGIELLQMLAAHPATRRHISAKLCARFVADEPPSGCIDAGIHAWERSDGNIRDVLAAIIASPEFWAEEYRGNKMKTPLEFLVSAVRAVDGVPGTDPAFALTLRRLGQPLYEYEPPTGYPETQESWVNSGALLERFNLAVAIAAGRMDGVSVDLDNVVPIISDHDALVDAVNHAILGGTASPTTVRVLRDQAAATNSPREARALLVGLAIGSPEFQRQ